MSKHELIYNGLIIYSLVSTTVWLYLIVSDLNNKVKGWKQKEAQRRAESLIQYNKKRERRDKSFAACKDWNNAYITALIKRD